MVIVIDRAIRSGRDRDAGSQDVGNRPSALLSLTGVRSPEHRNQISVVKGDKVLVNIGGNHRDTGQSHFTGSMETIAIFVREHQARNIAGFLVVGSRKTDTRSKRIRGLLLSRDDPQTHPKQNNQKTA